MLIVDAQIHLWEKGTPSAHHRQEPYSAEQAIAGMDEAGVDRALIHPVLWDPDSNELAMEAVRKYPDRFAIMGWFYLDDPNGRDLVAHWKERPGMLGLRFYIPTSGTRNPGSRTVPSTGCGPPSSAPKCRWRSARRCSCRQSARSPSATPA
jgi:predicted TIM-barrel fold metal-dependent hydrolase